MRERGVTEENSRRLCNPRTKLYLAIEEHFTPGRPSRDPDESKPE